MDFTSVHEAIARMNAIREAEHKMANMSPSQRESEIEKAKRIAEDAEEHLDEQDREYFGY